MYSFEGGEARGEEEVVVVEGAEEARESDWLEMQHDHLPESDALVET